MKKSILFIGLGRMGYPIASHIAATDNFIVSVYNRSLSKVDKWLQENKGFKFDTQTVYDYIILCVGNDTDVESIFEENAVFSTVMNDNTIIIDHTTTSAHLAKKINKKLNTKGVFYLDAPLSGGESGAVNGVLTCMIGGNENKFNQIKVVLNNYCKNTTYIGESGSGQMAKMANQFCIAGILAGLSEAITLVKKEGLNPNLVYDAIKNGASQSWQMDNRFLTMVENKFDFGFSIEHMIKDLKYAIEQANSQNWDPVISKNVLTSYEELLTKGYSTQDTSILIKKYNT